MRYFCDSQVTLARIVKDFGMYRLYTANRIKCIQQLSDVSKWYYVSTKDNWSADIGSRSADLQDFINSDMWTTGPSFLVDKNYVGVQIGKLPADKKVLDATERKVNVPVFHLTPKFPSAFL